MMPLTGHVATTVPPVGVDTHTVEYSDGELATERDADTEDDLLGVEVGMKPDVTDGDRDELTAGDARDPLTDDDGVTLRPLVGDTDDDGDGETSKHWA